MNTNTTIGQFLIKNNVISPQQLEEALRFQQEAEEKGRREKLGRIIVSLGYATEDDIAVWLSQYAGVEFQREKPTLAEVDIDTTKLFSQEELYSHEFLILKNGMALVSDPLDLQLRDMIKNRCRKKLTFKITTPKVLRSVLDELFKKEGVSVDETNTDELFREILYDAFKLGEISDIHFEPVSNKKGRIRFRREGVLINYRTLNRNTYDKLVTSIKYKSDIKTDSLVPQDGRMVIDVAKAGLLNIRVASYPTVLGESLVLRLLRAEHKIKLLDELGYSDEILEELKKLKTIPEGVFIVSGPTGSGKTTTLYALLDFVYNEGKKVLTIEDPVEYRDERFVQSQLNEQSGYDFDVALKHSLRNDPDIILLGEIRDEYSCRSAIRAAITGHLVLTTVHANSLKNIIVRLQELGGEPSLLEETLIGVMTQRLLRRVCPSCSRNKKSDDEVKKIFDRFDVKPPDEIIVATGCDDCLQTGYRGRFPVAVVKFAEIDKPLHESLKKTTNKGLALATLSAVSRGLTTIDEAIRVVRLL